MSKTCIINVGLYHTGNNILAKAGESVGYKCVSDFPDVDSAAHRDVLMKPDEAISTWWQTSGKDYVKQLLDEGYNFFSDGYFSLLPFLSKEHLQELTGMFKAKFGSDVRLVATECDMDTYIRSDLLSWVMRNLSKTAELDFSEQEKLERFLKERFDAHREALSRMDKIMEVKRLSLADKSKWSSTLSSMDSTNEWEDALQKADSLISNPNQPLEGVLLSFRFGDDKDETKKRVVRLLEQLEEDTLCKYCLVLAFDNDEADTDFAKDLVNYIENHYRASKVVVLKNKPKDVNSNKPFPVCEVWHNMATAAFKEGADWVVRLDDKADIKCAFHYRAFYRAFLDIAESTGCPFGFGAPYWNDESLPGTPTFPAIGRVHFDIFKGLIPEWRSQELASQDLDLYLHRLYLKYDAAPCVEDAVLTNKHGSTQVARLEEQAATVWKDCVVEDTKFVSKYLSSRKDIDKFTERTLVDIVTPTYRIDIPMISGICELEVPENWRLNYIIVIDNPTKLCKMMEEKDIEKASLKLQQIFTDVASKKGGKRVGNNVKVLCNHVNQGASASRNRGLDTTSAEFVLFLDDDIICKPDMMFAYDKALKTMDDNCIGFVGLVKFPRRQNMPLIHAAVLMSYLIFTFEIADNALFSKPNWGVTANLLVRHTKVRFDTVHFKIGGGEDVDFCLRSLGKHKLADERKLDNDKFFQAVPEAAVSHDFWKGGIPNLAHHIFYWGYGDSGLFNRYRDCCFWSYLNATEFFMLIFLPFCPVILKQGWRSIYTILAEMLAILFVDVALDMINLQSFNNRCLTLGEGNVFSMAYYLFAHILANIYVIVFQFGRMYGHWTRGKLLQNAGRRFDSQAGRLPDADKSFLHLERKKLVAFVIATLFVVRCV